MKYLKLFESFEESIESICDRRWPKGSWWSFLVLRQQINLIKRFSKLCE